MSKKTFKNAICGHLLKTLGGRPREREKATERSLRAAKLAA